VAADGGHRALVDVAEGLGGAAGEAVRDLAGDVLAALDRRLRDLWQRLVAIGGDVADREDLGMRRHRQVWVDHDAAAAPEFDPERRGQRVGSHARRPHQGLGGDLRAVGQHHTLGRHVGDAGAGDHLDAHLGEARARVLAALPAERRQQPGSGLDQHHPRPADVELREVLREHLREQLHQSAGHLDAGGPTTADHDVECTALDE
jgi:hypothetical protein